MKILPLLKNFATLLFSYISQSSVTTHFGAWWAETIIL